MPREALRQYRPPAGNPHQSWPRRTPRGYLGVGPRCYTWAALLEVSAALSEAKQERGHRWFAAAWNWISIPGERSLGKRVRPRLLADLRGRVLEIGVGTGHSLAHYPAEAGVIATDPDPHMLKRAQQRLAQLGRANIELRQAPAEELPFDDASFDHVVSTLVLCSVSDQGRALAEARRVLKAEGTFRFWEHIRNDRSRFWGRSQDVIRPVWSWLGGGCQINRRTQDAIVDAGFRIEWQEEDWRFPLNPVIYGVARPR